MKSKLILVTAISFLPIFAFAWGAEGHKMVANIAKDKLNPGIEAKVQKYLDLDTTTFENAAVWMDEQRSNRSYDYMKPWHYTNIEVGATYAKAPEGDVVSELQRIIDELKNYKTMANADVEKDLKILFHLCGDIVQPLHVGYGSDKGGNAIKVMLDGRQTNLHHVWDTDIITKESITKETCLQLIHQWSSTQINSYQKTDVMAWMTDSRSLLPGVYNFQNGEITQSYLDTNKPVVVQQLSKGGLRLANVLNTIFAH